MDNDNHVYMFFHIPKTAGSTMRTHIRNNLAKRSQLCLFNGDHAENEKAHFADPKTAGQWKKCRVVAGHFVHKGLPAYVGRRPVRFFTVLRDPVSRLISQYNWGCKVAADANKPAPAPFDKWLTSPARYNPQARVILAKFLQMKQRKINAMNDDQLFEAARNALKDFWLIGNQENLESSMAPLFEALGLPAEITESRKVAGVHLQKAIEKTPEIVALAEANSKVDRRIYEEFCSR